VGRFSDPFSVALKQGRVPMSIPLYASRPRPDSSRYAGRYGFAPNYNDSTSNTADQNSTALAAVGVSTPTGTRTVNTAQQPPSQFVSVRTSEPTVDSIGGTSSQPANQPSSGGGGMIAAAALVAAKLLHFF
jgi:hypothetical protein